jgi:hypothetical protein
LKIKLVAKSSQVGVEYIFVEIRLLQKTLLVGSVYRQPITSVVYRLLGAQGYGLSALEEVILPGRYSAWKIFCLLYARRSAFKSINLDPDLLCLRIFVNRVLLMDRTK